MKKIYIALLAAAAAVSLAACGLEKKPAETGGAGKIPVAVSFDAMKELTEAVGGDLVSVSVIVPDGTEPHDFEPGADDLKRLGDARLFVYNGLGMERWAERAVKAAGNDELLAVEASKDAPLLAVSGDDAEESVYDPHLWLSLDGAEREAANIRDALIRIAPERESAFRANYDAFAGELETLRAEYAGLFAGASRKTLVTGHAAFGYLARDFGLEEKSVEDVFASGEPSPAKLTELTRYCRDNGVKTVFTEELVSPAVSETLAREAGAGTAVIYTMESSEGGLSYMERMKDNLRRIYEALA